MKRVIITMALMLAAALPASASSHTEMAKSKAASSKAASSGWAMNATAIEACSCPMFCQCYFDTKPAAHAVEGEHEGHTHGGGEHYCRFNNAFKVNKGTYNGVKLDGAKFWVYGDLGSDFSDGEMDWAVVTFDKATSQAQRDAIGTILGHLYPVKWKSLTTAEGDIDWVAGKTEAFAKLDGGKTAEVALSTGALKRNSKAAPMVIKNLQYFGAPRNDGFILMPNTIETVRVGDKPFEFKGTNGFMITVDIDSKSVAAPAGSGGGY